MTKHVPSILFALLLVVMFYVHGAIRQKSHEAGLREEDNDIFFMNIKSSAFSHNERIPKKYTCDGKDVNPPLEISGVPSDAVSLALVVDDPDAPRGTWVHWVVWNLKPRDQVIEEGTLPSGAKEGMTDFGRTGWGGPCPPPGTHRYFFKLYALKGKPSFDESHGDVDALVTKSILEREMQKVGILAQTEIIGLYSREEK